LSRDGKGEELGIICADIAIDSCVEYGRALENLQELGNPASILDILRDTFMPGEERRFFRYLHVWHPP